MRIRITLQPYNSTQLTANYNHPLSGAIYKLLQLGGPEFSAFLHDIGFQTNGKHYKLFNFALRFPYKPEFWRDIITLPQKDIHLFVSSPLISTFINNLLSGTMQHEIIELAYKNVFTSLLIRQIEALPEPEFQSPSRFMTLSPLVVSTRQEHEGRLTQRYLTFDDDISEIDRIINLNLANKYSLVHNRPYTGPGINFTWDTAYMKNALAHGKRLTKLIEIQGKNGNPIKVRANDLPFIISGDRELVQIGYDCGFGEKNSMGFGMGDL